jgi:uncharacterized repeat protein (TIGR03803 family)
MPATVTTIASLPTPGADGTKPDGQLFIDSNGDLFGATVLGGTTGLGQTYEIAKIGAGYASTPTFLAVIPGSVNTLVNVPNLSADANGDLFGLMFSGGANTLGTVVEFPAGGGPEVQLANFTGAAGGSHPGGHLLVDASGNLFGTTLSGGANNAGTVFEIQKTGGGYAATPITLTSFGSGITPSGLGNLVEDAAGDLFGTTTSSVFEVKKTGGIYAPPVSLVPFPVGTQIGTLTIDAKGDIFGTTITGGGSDDGTVFEIEKTATGYASTPATLASFSLADGQLSLNHPKTLIVDANGDLFGTTDPSSQNPGGVVFEIVRRSTGYDITPTIVVNFNGLTDGSLGANLVADANGNLFGTTQAGGANNKGTAFEITNSGFATIATISAPNVHPNNLSQIVHPNNLALSGDVTGAHNFIDTLNFVASYGDLVNAFGTNQQAAQNWYNTQEPIENRVETFDGLDYVASYGDLINAFKSAGSEQAVLDAGAAHFINDGSHEGRTTTFNGLDYIASYGDLINAFGANGDAGAYHYIENGASEGRKTTFDGLDYIASYGDLIKAFGANEQAGAEHFIDNGFKEGRTTTFNGLDYIASYGDLIKAFGANNDAGATHYIDNGHNEGRTTTFDGLDYIASYGDLINALGANEQAGAEHFIGNGFKEGRTTTFDGLDYIANYTDLMKTFGANNDAGAAHYITNGHSEGRSTTFNVGAYESAHPDLPKFSSNDAFLTDYISTYQATGKFLT